MLDMLASIRRDSCSSASLLSDSDDTYVDGDRTQRDSNGCRPPTDARDI